MNRAELERIVDGRARAIAGELVAELRDDLHEEASAIRALIAELDQRLTETHRQALKVLTDHYSRR